MEFLPDLVHASPYLAPLPTLNYLVSDVKLEDPNNRINVLELTFVNPPV